MAGKYAIKFYRTKRWKLLRLHVLRRDGYRCVKCAGPGREVDHIKRMSDGGSAYDPANLQALCRACHRAKTAGENRNDWLGRMPAGYADLVKLGMGAKTHA